jgi:long-chain acyl-CoA synthetase
MSFNTLAELTRSYRAEQGDKRALYYTGDGRSWTYEDLDREACQVANALKAMGIGPQDRVAYLDRNAPEYFTLFFGGTKLNAVSVAVNWRLAAPEMEYILNNSDARVLVIGEEFLGQLAQMDLKLGANVVVIGDPGDTGFPSFDQWIAAQPQEDPGAPVAAEDTCYQLYTSGTTGLPKGVEITNANMVHMLEQTLSGPLAMTPEAVNLVCMPLFHVSGSGWALGGVYAGAESILLRDVDLQEILRSIQDHRITHSVFVPAVLQFLLAQPNVGEFDYSSLKAIVYGASPITEEVLVGAMETFGADFYQVYGLTETTAGITQLLPEDHDPGGPRAHLLRSCGKVIVNHELRIVDRDSGETLGDNEVGEIWIRGPQIMRGYWNNPQATAESITADGWFRSGDAGYLVDGYLFIHDRVKDMIISGGENIYPAEIENVLMAHPDIADAAVIGIPSDRWGETVKAIITPRGDGLTEEQVISHCRQNLAHYKCPTSVDWMETIPRNPSGKILKTELRKPYWEGRDRNVS